MTTWIEIDVPDDEPDALNTARALRLVLAYIRADQDGSRMVFDEFCEMFQACDAVSLLASILAEEMSIAHGPEKAARDLEKRIAGLLDFAAPRHDPPT